MTQIVVVNGGELFGWAPLPYLLVLKYTNNVAYLFRGVKYFILKVVSFNVYKKGIDLGRIAIKFFRERVLGPLAGSWCCWRSSVP